MANDTKLDNQLLVIFGASGDLTWRKLIPALFHAHIEGSLPDNFAVLGVGRTELSDDDFRLKMHEGIAQFVKHSVHEDVVAFTQKLYYISIDTSATEGYVALKDRLTQLHTDLQTLGNTIYYLSTPPSLYATIVEQLKLQNLASQTDGAGWKRFIVEKPFGYDLASARELNAKLLSQVAESQIYRIDHYLGKETAQNILVTRFFNGIFEPLWNRNYVSYVEITSAESVGVEGRGGYYDKSGALRDMLQNHLLQLAAFTAMEPPGTFTADAIRDEVIKVFQSLRPLTDNDLEHSVIRGQYTESHVQGKAILGYNQEPGVPHDSRTETFVALKFYIDNWRWGGVPFYIRTGKKLPTRVAEIVIHFKPTPHPLLKRSVEDGNLDSMLIIRIQPDEGIVLKFGMKTPGAGFNVQAANMSFRYSELSDQKVPDAYQRLLLDCMAGDASLFARGDAVEAAWEFVDPILKDWKNNPHAKLFGYPAGTWGPLEADALIEGAAQWRYPCKNLTNDGVYCEL